MQDAGFKDYYVTCLMPTKDAFTGGDWESRINNHKPKIIIPLDSAGGQFNKALIPTRRGANYDEEKDSEISKYAGSLLQCDRFQWPHYVVPTYGPDFIARQWKQRDIVVSCDLQKAALELEYWRKNGILQPLPIRTCQIDFSCFDELLHIIMDMRNTPIISNDIETIYPRDKSVWKGLHPGYPITIGLASSASFGISFNLFRDNVVETRELWRALNNLFKETIQLGQNFFNFDINFYKMLGFEIDPKRVIDTMIRHAILWPELQHKLQFLTRQYTRQPYYKDEGHGWSLKDMRGLKHYNCLDVCVTREVYDEQEKEFEERPHLK